MSSTPPVPPLSSQPLTLADQIDCLLPQTQCGQCGYPGCRPYAEAIAQGQADINQCPPGGQEGVIKLAQMMHISPKPLNPVHGLPKPPALAVIDEQACIGCTLCIKACPVDAIVGAAKQMHTILGEECTGCELCLAPCPVDCIHMKSVPVLSYNPYQAKKRYLFRLYRLEKAESEKQHRLQQRQVASAKKSEGKSPHADLIKAALEKAKLRQAQLEQKPGSDQKEKS